MLNLAYVPTVPYSPLHSLRVSHPCQANFLDSARGPGPQGRDQHQSSAGRATVPPVSFLQHLQSWGLSGQLICKSMMIILASACISETRKSKTSQQDKPARQASKTSQQDKRAGRQASKQASKRGNEDHLLMMPWLCNLPSERERDREREITTAHFETPSCYTQHSTARACPTLYE